MRRCRAPAGGGRAPSGSVHLLGNRYWAECLHEMIGKKVTLRFDPDNLQEGVRVYHLDGRFVGFAECVESAGFADTTAARDHARRRNAFLKATKEAAALEKGMAPAGRLLDLGTGTGAIALAFASERPGWRVLGVDLRPEAVALARRNAARLAIVNAEFRQSDWFSALEAAGEGEDAQRFALIVSNPPYLADDDPHLARGDVRFEPASALVAGDAGLADLRHLVGEARRHLVAGGWLLLEHGAKQGAAVRQALLAAGYREVATRCDLAGHERVSLGRGA